MINKNEYMLKNPLFKIKFRNLNNWFNEKINQIIYVNIAMFYQ